MHASSALSGLLSHGHHSGHTPVPSTLSSRDFKQMEESRSNHPDPGHQPQTRPQLVSQGLSFIYSNPKTCDMQYCPMKQWSISDIEMRKFVTFDIAYIKFVIRATRLFYFNSCTCIFTGGQMYGSSALPGPLLHGHHSGHTPVPSTLPSPLSYGHHFVPGHG